MFRRTSTLIALTILFVGTFAWAAGAFNPQPDPPLEYSLVGITSGDIARFSLVSIDNPELIDTPDLRCDGRAIFLDAQGAVLATHPFELRAGEGTFFDLSLADVRQRPGNRDRLTLRPAYQPAERNECQLLPTLEILDARTMQTRFVHPLARVGFNPQPDPPFEG